MSICEDRSKAPCRGFSKGWPLKCFKSGPRKLCESNFIFLRKTAIEMLRERRAKVSRKIFFFPRRMAVLFRKNIDQSSCDQHRLAEARLTPGGFFQAHILFPPKQFLAKWAHSIDATQRFVSGTLKLGSFDVSKQLSRNRSMRLSCMDKKGKVQDDLWLPSCWFRVSGGGMWVSFSCIRDIDGFKLYSMMPDPACLQQHFPSLIVPRPLLRAVSILKPPRPGFFPHVQGLNMKFQSSSSVASIVHMLFVDLSLKFSFHRLCLRPTEAVHRMSLVTWVSWADWQSKALEQGVKVKGVVYRSLSFFVDTLGNHCLSETWTDQALCKWFRMTFSST